MAPPGRLHTSGGTGGNSTAADRIQQLDSRLRGPRVVQLEPSLMHCQRSRPGQSGLTIIMPASQGSVIGPCIQPRLNNATLEQH